jgi:hypothetical protein
MTLLDIFTFLDTCPNLRLNECELNYIGL